MPISSITSTRSSTSRLPAGLSERALGLLRLVHPFPSALNAALVLGIALVAQGSVPLAVILATSMLGIQFCIGSVNDLFDEQLDALSKPHKPIPAGLVSRREAWAVALATGAIGLGMAAVARAFDPFLVLMSAVMLGAGLVYDARLKLTRFAWLCFAVAFPILPVFAWYGVTGNLPPRWEVLLPVAALCGPYLQLANGLVDYETDRDAGLRTLPIVLGVRLLLVAMTVLLVTIHSLAWLTLASSTAPEARVLTAAATGIAVCGLLLSARFSRRSREAGWMLQAAAVAVLGGSWLLAAAG